MDVPKEMVWLDMWASFVSNEHQIMDPFHPFDFHASTIHLAF